MISELLIISVGAILINNFVLVQFLGICPFLGVSKKVETASGMGFAVVFVMICASALTWLVQEYLLIPFGIEYMQTIAFILVIAVLVQFVEMFLQKSVPSLYNSLGVYLPLITTNCAVLGVAINNITKFGGTEMSFVKSIVYGGSAGLGFTLAIVLFAGVRERLETSDVPEFLKGMPIVLVTAALLSIAFLGFSGLSFNLRRSFVISQILIPIIIVGGMGIVFGILLGVASKIFEVKTDERIPKITEALPGANCGGCGFAGCAAYADAIVNGGAKTNMCPVGGAAVAKRVSEIMGVKTEEKEPMTARVMCSGAHGTAVPKFEYDGAANCHTAAGLGGGEKLCPNACLGFGSCTAVCKFGAISVKDGVAVTDEEKCTGCGMCAEECPKHIIKLVPSKTKYTVACSSKEK